MTATTDPLTTRQALDTLGEHFNEHVPKVPDTDPLREPLEVVRSVLNHTKTDSFKEPRWDGNVTKEGAEVVFTLNSLVGETVSRLRPDEPLGDELCESAAMLDRIATMLPDVVNTTG